MTDEDLEEALDALCEATNKLSRRAKELADRCDDTGDVTVLEVRELRRAVAANHNAVNLLWARWTKLERGGGRKKYRVKSA